MCTLIIAYALPGQQPCRVASIDDPQLLREAAVVALMNADRRAREAAAEDVTLGHLRAAEAARLRTALSAILPDVFREQDEALEFVH